MHFECPACGATSSIDKRKVRRTRQKNIECGRCGAILGVKGGRSGLDVIVVMAGGSRSRPDPVQPLDLSELPGLPELPAVAVFDEDAEPGFDPANRDKTDPDAAAPIPIETMGAIPRVGLPDFDDYEAPFGEIEEDTEPGAGAPVMGEGEAPWGGDTLRDSSPVQVVRDHDRPVGSSGPRRPDRASGDSGKPRRGVPSPEPEAAQAPPPSFFGDTPAPGPHPSAPSAASAEPVVLQLPDPSTRRRSKADVQQMLQEFSVMFRLDTRTRRRRSAAITLVVATALGLGILGVVLASSATDPGLLAAVHEDLRDLRPVRDTAVPTPSGGGTAQVSALGAELVAILRARIDEAALRARRASERRAEQAASARAAAKAAAKAAAASEAARRKKARRKRSLRRRARRRRLTLPSLD